MTPGHWERLKPLFDRALRLPPEELAVFIEQVGREEAELGRELADLIRGAQTGALDRPLLDRPLLDGHGILSTDSISETATALAPGLLGGRFRLLRPLGRGGMGEVYEAEDLQLRERVALKMIRREIAADPQAVARFKREILLGKRVAHPNVCRIHDLGVAVAADGAETLFLTMQFLAGETLAKRMERGAMPADEAFPLIENMADGLAAAHDAGIVHRDFKSGNVMLIEVAGRLRAVVTDFGLARAVKESEDWTLSKPGAVAGTVGYMAPEQIRGESATAAADIYALGVVMYEMVTGRLPFSGDSQMEVALQHLNEAPPSPRRFAPALDAKWEAAILCCLRKNPGERFACADDLKAALGASDGGAIPRRRLRERKLAVISAAVICLVLAACSAWFFFAKSEQRVAVLEFTSVDDNPVNQAFCEGLMETLASQLTELEQFHDSLSVVPASDIRREKAVSAREAQRDFGVTLVITGSVQRAPGGIRLTINVVDARQLKQLRSHTMFVAETDAVSMQEGVIAQVTDLLNIQLHPDAKRLLAQGNTAVPGAYDLYLQGSGHLAAGRNGVDQAIESFSQALERDPNYALAHAGLGEAYWIKYSATKDRAWVDKAWSECRRSLALGPKLSEPHITLALLNTGTGNYEEALREAGKAIQTDPYNSRAYSELARALEAVGQLEKAETTLKKAIALSPGYWYNYIRLGIFYGKQARYKEAEAPFQRVIELVPENPAGYTNLGAIYHYEGREAEAENVLRKSIEVRPTPRAYANLATVYFFERRYADALPIMLKQVTDQTKDYVEWGNLGDAYRWTPGQREKAEGAYRRAITLARAEIKVNQRDGDALGSLALYEAKVGETSGALADMLKALAASPKDKTVLFDAAVICELAGERARALKFIHGAIVGGYSPNEIATEPELEKLRQDSRYLAAVSRK